jgi:hypothetical protein
MLVPWIVDDDVLTTLGITPGALTCWRQGKSKAVEKILGRNIRARPRTDGELGFEFWRSDIDRIKRTAIPLTPFKEWEPVAKRDVTWLPTRDVITNYSWHRRIEKWFRRARCPFLENGRLPDTKPKFVLAPDNVGLQEVTFYLKEDLDEIDTNMRRAKNPADGLKAMTKLVENGSVSRWRVFKSPRPKKLRLDKRGRPQEMVVLSSDQVAAHKIPSQLPSTDAQGRELITPKQVEDLTGKAFLITTMLYWEKHPNPYSQKCLEIVYQDRLVSYKEKKTGQTVWYIQKQAKHYVKKTILEAYEAYKSSKQAPVGRKSSEGIVEPASGGVYMTALAANREHGANKQALEAWRVKGWLDWIKEDRTGPGPYKKVVCYREDGERGFVYLQSLQAGRSRRIPPSIAAKLTAVFADHGIPMKSAASTTEGPDKDALERRSRISFVDDPGHPVRLASIAPAVLAQVAKIVTGDVETDERESVLDPQEQARHSADFRSVHWFGKVYYFSPTQAACIKVLWQAWKNRTPEIGQDTVLEDPGVEANAKRLIDVFRDRDSESGYHPAWGIMIVSGSTKGSFRLNPQKN